MIKKYGCQFLLSIAKCKTKELNKERNWFAARENTSFYDQPSTLTRSMRSIDDSEDRRTIRRSMLTPGQQCQGAHLTGGIFFREQAFFWRYYGCSHWISIESIHCSIWSEYMLWSESLIWTPIAVPSIALQSLERILYECPIQVINITSLTMSKVAWSVCCKKFEGGLCIVDLEQATEALLSIWVLVAFQPIQANIEQFIKFKLINTKT